MGVSVVSAFSLESGCSVGSVDETIDPSFVLEFNRTVSGNSLLSGTDSVNICWL